MSRRKRRHKSNAPAKGPGGNPVDGASTAERLRPWLLAAIVALFVARPLYPSETPGETGDGLTVVMLWIAVAVVWMLGVVGRRRFSIRFGWTDAAVLGLVGWHTLAAIVATGHGSPRPAINVLWEWIGLGLAYFLARQFIATRREARAVVVVMIAVAVAVSGCGLYQVFHDMAQTRAEYYRDPDEALRKIGQWSPEGSPQRMAFEKRLESSEPLATFALTNSLAGYLAPWLIVAAGIGLGAGGFPKGKGVPWRTWIAVACCAAPVTFCLLLTKSRSAYLATLVGLLLLAAWWVRSRLHSRRLSAAGWKLPATVLLGVAVALAGIVAATVAGGWLDRQILSEASKSLGYRVEYWRATLDMIADHPLLGSGPGNFQHEYTRYKLPEASEEVADPHNFLLEVWATAGTPAMLALLAVLGTFAWSLWRRGNATNDETVGRISDPSYEQSDDGLRRTDATRFVLAGGACGFLLAVPIGMISAAPPGLAVLWLGLPLAAGSAALSLPWINSGRLLPVVLAIGVVVLLVNLLAAGGFGFPGVAGTLWLLMALGVNMAGGDRRTLPWSAAVAGLVVALALAFACHKTAYAPVLRSQAAMRQAQREGKPFAKMELLSEAAEYDSRSAAPWEQLASAAFQWWLEDPMPAGDALSLFTKSAEIAVELAPNSATFWREAGERYLEIGKQLTEISRKDRDPAYRNRAAWAFDRAVEHYRRAVELYPNSAAYRAGLAEALLSAGDREGFQAEAEEALRLDGLTPHADKKLPDELRKKLSRTLSSL